MACSGKGFVLIFSADDGLDMGGAHAELSLPHASIHQVHHHQVIFVHEFVILKFAFTFITAALSLTKIISEYYNNKLHCFCNCWWREKVWQSQRSWCWWSWL